jgi:hypothetical protein
VFENVNHSIYVCSATIGEDRNCADQFLAPTSVADHLLYLNFAISTCANNAAELFLQ